MHLLFDTSITGLLRRLQALINFMTEVLPEIICGSAPNLEHSYLLEIFVVNCESAVIELAFDAVTQICHFETQLGSVLPLRAHEST